MWWADLGEPVGSVAGYVRPVVVISSDQFNDSEIRTLVVVAITSNLRLGKAPGNVALRQGEAGLPKASVINVSQIATVNKFALVTWLGDLPSDRIDELAAGIRRSLML